MIHKKKKICCLALCLGIAMSCLTVSASEVNENSTSEPLTTYTAQSSEAPSAPLNANGYYEISSAEQLMWFAQLVNNGSNTANALLTASIDMADCTGWVRMGTYSGIFDGQGNYIRNLNNNTDGQGFIGTLDGTVKNLSFTNATVFYNVSGGAGVIAAKNNGTISGCIVSDSAIQYGAYDSLGILTGINYGTIENCAAIGCNITRRYGGSGSKSMGGIAETNRNTIQNCFTYNCHFNNGSSRAPITSDNNSKVNNCYYYTTSDISSTYGTAMTEAQFSSGEVAYLLGTPWGQTCGTGLPATGGSTVYKVPTTGCTTDVYAYTNDSTALSVFFPHSYGHSGICSVCGKSQYEPDISEGSILLTESDGVTYYTQRGGTPIAYSGSLKITGTTMEHTITIESGDHDLEFNNISIYSTNVSPLTVSGGSLNLTLIGDNTLNEADSKVSTNSCGRIRIESGTALTITDSSNGTLTLYGCALDHNNYGTENPVTTADLIDGNGDLTICGGTINNFSSDRGGIGIGGNLTINGGAVNLDFLAAKNVTINGGYVTVSGLAGTLAMLGGFRPNDSNGGGTHGIYASQNITITGGRINASAYPACFIPNAMVCQSSQGHGLYALGTVSISGGTVAAKGNDSPYGSNELGAMSQSTPNGGYGIYADSIIITGGNVKAVGYCVILDPNDESLFMMQVVEDAACAVSTAPSNGTKPVALSTITLEDVAAEAAIYSIIGIENYGTKDVTTLDTNKLYLWKPDTETVGEIIIGTNGYKDPDGDGTFSLAGASEIVSASIAWSSMEFTYATGQWNPETHTYDEGMWTASDGAGSISVTNNSNVPVNITFHYEETVHGISGTFTKDTLSLNAGKTERTTFKPGGKPNTELNHAELGIITVTVAKANAHA